MNKTKSGLKRPVSPMSPAIRKKLSAAGLLRAYQARPAYQKNDYLRWIKAAKLETTREKRTQQMLRELKAGNVYMKMKWNSR
jgi:uncharacterized protein YdeI (YjbR/CyaY-like superfamily)